MVAVLQCTVPNPFLGALINRTGWNVLEALLPLNGNGRCVVDCKTQICNWYCTPSVFCAPIKPIPGNYKVTLYLHYFDPFQFHKMPRQRASGEYSPAGCYRYVHLMIFQLTHTLPGFAAPRPKPAPAARPARAAQHHPQPQHHAPPPAPAGVLEELKPVCSGLMPRCLLFKRGLRHHPEQFHGIIMASLAACLARASFNQVTMLTYTASLLRSPCTSPRNAPAEQRWWLPVWIDGQRGSG